MSLHGNFKRIMVACSEQNPYLVFLLNFPWINFFIFYLHKITRYSKVHVYMWL